MKIIKAALVAAALSCGIAQAAPKDLGEADIGAIAVVIEDAAGNYTVVNERMDETGTAGALFGLAGAAINSAQNNAQDAGTADRWREAAGTLDIGGMVEAAILETLTKRGDGLEVVQAAEAAGHTLFVDVQDWGLGRTTRETDELRAFIKLNVRIEDARGRTVWKDHPVKRGGLAAANLTAFTEEVFVEELTKLAEKSGRAVAYEIIYR